MKKIKYIACLLSLAVVSGPKVIIGKRVQRTFV